MKRRLGAAVACLLAKRHREAVLGDLEEVGRSSGTPGHLGALIGIVVRFHAEPWGDDGARWGALVTVVLAGGLLGIVLAATWPDPGAVLALYDDPLSRAAIHVWSAPHLTAAVAGGLIIGHSPWIPAFAGTLRWQLALALALPASWAAPGGFAILAPLLLLAATWVGQRGLPSSGVARGSRHHAR
jgi:hypothetical protein